MWGEGVGGTQIANLGLEQERREIGSRPQKLAFFWLQRALNFKQPQTPPRSRVSGAVVAVSWGGLGIRTSEAFLIGPQLVGSSTQGASCRVQPLRR